MAREHDVLRHAMGRRGKRHHWHEVLHAAHRVTQRRTAESERTLARVLAHQGALSLRGRELPHALSPADLLRALAIQALARWNPRKHRGAIARVHATTESYLLAEIAKANL